MKTGINRTVVYYGLALAAVLLVLKWVEYGYVVHDLSQEFYIGAIATIFTAFGVWAGLRWTHRSRQQPAFASELVLAPEQPTGPDPSTIGISKREFEVLTLIAEGHSNQEIADKLFVSLHTVKKHTSSVFQKLEVSRRTQAVEKARQIGLI